MLACEWLKKERCSRMADVAVQMEGSSTTTPVLCLALPKELFDGHYWLTGRADIVTQHAQSQESE